MTSIGFNPDFKDYRSTSKFISGMLKERISTENESTDSTINGNGDPNANIFKKFQIGATLGRAYNRLKDLVATRNEDKEQEKETQNLALGAG
jgi:hypothetical protein